MEFKTQSLRNILTRLSETKFSIRLSILSIVLVLLVGISAIIIGINHYTLNSVLIASAKNSLSQSSGKVAEQVRSYLQPLNSNILTAHRMFSSGVVSTKQPEFSKFLYSLIIDNEALVAAYWTGVDGNSYWLNKVDQGFFEEVVLRDNNGVQAIGRNLDLQGKILTTKDLPLAAIDDGHLRPWYQQAVAKKKPVWITYNFMSVGTQAAQLGVTSAFPIYDAEGKLQGVLGIDMLLGAISRYVENIELTENSFIFVVDLAGNLMAAHAKHKNIAALNKVTEITAANIPWIEEAFNVFHQKHDHLFAYSFDGKDYIAASEKILDVKSDSPWFVAIITPVDDIVAPLRKNILISFGFVLFTLLLGVVMASIFSSSLSRPIKNLAKDADWISQLQLENIQYLFSRIKEISNMADAFMRMKNTLYSFQRYMPVALIKKLIISDKVATVGGEEKELTLLFTDIQDFTELSEIFDPEKLMQYLSEYFQSITKIIIETYGTVDKYIGDGVMAFWGAPIDDTDHVLHACQAALRIQKALQQLNLKWCQENKPVLVTRLGINTGWVVVGNVGSDDKLNYTSLGDPVNLASRLEGLNKVYDTSIIVSEFIYEKIKDKFKCRLLDRVAVKGKKRSVYIYELLDEVTFAEPDLDLNQYNQDFYRAFAVYERGDWTTALQLFNKLDKIYPDDHVIKIFIDRCSKFSVNPPQEWKGIWVMEEK